MDITNRGIHGGRRLPHVIILIILLLRSFISIPHFQKHSSLVSRFEVSLLEKDYHTQASLLKILHSAAVEPYIPESIDYLVEETSMTIASTQLSQHFMTRNHF